MFRLLSALLLALPAACTAAPPLLDPAARASAVGKTRAEVLASFGEPTESAIEGERERLTYVHDRLVLYGPSGPATANRYYCSVTFLLAWGRVDTIETTGPDCGG
jgi:hypothetical protein